MCKINDVGLLGLTDECCGDDPDDCDITTVEGDMLKAACDDVIDLVNGMREAVDTGEDTFLENRCLDLTIAVGELVRQVVEYTEPDAGLEPI